MKVLVIKVGGGIPINNLVEDIKVLLKNYRIVIVHGGGEDVNRLMKVFNKEPIFINGLRYTDKDTLEIIKMVFTKIREEIVSNLSVNGIKSIGLSGANGIFEISPLDLKKYGYVAKIIGVNTNLLENLIKEYVAVISPIGIDKNGNFYNINADEVASKLSIWLKAERLIFLTKKPGILMNIHDEKSIIEEININNIQDFINKGFITGGMLTKILSCEEAIRRNVDEIIILSGMIKNPILKYFEGKLKGTRIFKG